MLKEGVSVLLLQRPLTSLVKEKIWRVDLLENPDDLSDCEPETGTAVSAVPFVTDVVHPLLRLLSLMKMSPWILTLV